MDFFSPILRFLQNRNHNNIYKDPVNVSSENFTPEIAFFVIFRGRQSVQDFCKQITLETIFSALYFLNSTCSIDEAKHSGDIGTLLFCTNKCSGVIRSRLKIDGTNTKETNGD